MLCVYNPIDEPVTRTIRVDLRYTGLDDRALVSLEDAHPVEVELARDFTIELECTVPARAMAWWVVRDPRDLNTPDRTPPGTR